MVRRKVSSTIAAFIMLGQASSAVAADLPSGMASNRMALAMPVAPEGAVPCTPNTDNANNGVAPCDPGTPSSGYVFPVKFLLAGIAAAGAVGAVAIGASGGHSHPAGGGTSPVSP